MISWCFQSHTLSQPIQNMGFEMCLLTHYHSYVAIQSILLVTQEQLFLEETVAVLVLHGLLSPFHTWSLNCSQQRGWFAVLTTSFKKIKSSLQRCTLAKTWFRLCLPCRLLQQLHSHNLGRLSHTSYDKCMNTCHRHVSSISQPRFTSAWSLQAPLLSAPSKIHTHHSRPTANERELHRSLCSHQASIHSHSIFTHIHPHNSTSFTVHSHSTPLLFDSNRHLKFALAVSVSLKGTVLFRPATRFWFC